MIIANLDYLEEARNTSYPVKGGVDIRVTSVLVRQVAVATATSLAYFGDARSAAGAFSGVFRQ